MVQKCSVQGCKSEYYPGCKLIFHEFPNDPKRKQLWQSLVQLKGKITQSSRICSLHFKHDDYKVSWNLSENAAPYCPVIVIDSKRINANNDDEYNLELKTENDLDQDILNTDFRQVSNSIDLRQNINELTSFIKLTVAHDSKQFNKNGANESILEQCNYPTQNNDTSFSQESNVSRQAVNNEGNLNHKKNRVYKNFVGDMNIQTKIKTAREILLHKQIQAIAQRVRRQRRKILALKPILNKIKKHALRSEIENIFEGSFANICDMLKTSRKFPAKYSEDLKTFCLTLYFYSPRAYNYLRTFVLLPHESTLVRILNEKEHLPT